VIHPHRFQLQIPKNPDAGKMLQIGLPSQGGRYALPVESSRLSCQSCFVHLFGKEKKEKGEGL
jgi:hypothetical protein